MNNTHTNQSSPGTTPQDYLNAITAAYPCPALSGFERAHWLYQTREALKWISDFISEEYKLQLTDISVKGITSQHYSIVPKERQESRVNLNLLRDRFPDIFENLVHLRATDAQKILGRSTVYQLAREKLGEDTIRQYETVNVTDLEKALTPQQTAGLITVRTKTIDWEVVEVNP